MQHPDNATSLGENAYWVFISFLYAWVAAKIAERFWDLSREWSTYDCTKPKHWSVPVISHLVLSSFIVGTSFVGWTQTFEDRHVIAPPHVIHWWSLMLIVDFWILSMYYCLVGNVSQERTEATWGPTREHNGCAAYWVLWIMVGYCVWDFFVYWLIPRLLAKISTGRFSAWGSNFWVSSWMTLYCTVPAVVAYFFLRQIRAERLWRLTAGDLSLLFLTLFYRALKQTPSVMQVCQISHPAQPGGVMAQCAQPARIDSYVPPHNLFTWGAFALFLLFGAVAAWPDRHSSIAELCRDVDQLFGRARRLFERIQGSVQGTNQAPIRRNERIHRG